ncbi:MAG: hypothetical protein GYA21_16370 [Myxococcales bacterium]|nr:hypothetical protein [Myxococcales bacterium]
MSRPWQHRPGFSLLSPALLAAWLAACGGEPTPTAGIISGSIAYSGTWPESGYLVLSLFRIAPWSPEYVPGAPAAFKYFQAGSSSPLSFSFDNPPIAFGSYAALMVAWKDPDDTDPRTGMRPVSVHGTTLDRMENASPITLSPDHPEEKGIVMPEMVLYPTAAEMRSHYPPL